MKGADSDTLERPAASALSLTGSMTIPRVGAKTAKLVRGWYLGVCPHGNL